MSQRQSQQAFWSTRTVKQEISASQEHYFSQQSQHSSPYPLLTLPDVVARHPQGDAAECDNEGRKGGRRAEHDIILEMINKGAFFLEFQHPKDLEGKPVVLDTKGRNDFKQMENKGFLVTKDGCLIPYEHYCTQQKGATLKGYQRSVYYFTGLSTAATASLSGKKQCVPASSCLDDSIGWFKTSTDTASSTRVGAGAYVPRECRKTVRDKDGWPTDSQVSHLCHRGACCRPDHLQLELRVCNVRRNYCGILSKIHGGCDCGMVPNCVRMYAPENHGPPLQLCENQTEVQEALIDLRRRYPYRLIPREHVKVDAIKKRNAAERARAGAKCIAKSEKRARRSTSDQSTRNAKQPRNS